MSDALAALSLRAQAELAQLSYPARPWVRPRSGAHGEHVYDVLIVGAGQGGLAAAFALKRERVDNILVVDQNPLDRAGPWRSFARMRTLRTPKHLTGPDLGIPSLTPQAFYEALCGQGSWQSLTFLPKELWADYLRWYRETLGLPVRAETRVGALRWDESERAFRVPCARGDQTEELLARRVVLATGIEGSGQWHVPDSIRGALSQRLYAHTSADIDFDALRGKRVVVLGAGASAFDNAATALEQGAAELHLLFRRSELVAINPYRWAEFVGFLKHFGDLPDAQKWRFISQIIRMGQLPPRDTFERARELPGFHLHAGCTRLEITERAGRVHVHTHDATLSADFLIVGTGFITDLSLRPELLHVEGAIARWSDRYAPAHADGHEDLLRHPYLGSYFELTERDPGSAPWLGYLFNYTFGSLLSLGFGGASISGMKYSLVRLTSGITRSLFLEDSEHYFDTLCAYAEREL